MILESIQILDSEEFAIVYEFETIAQTNWNAEWEKNFNPILVDDHCAIRAPFHEPFNVKYDIVIEPKMSFGTGHHETTHMMIQHILAADFKTNPYWIWAVAPGYWLFWRKKKELLF